MNVLRMGSRWARGGPAMGARWENPHRSSNSSSDGQLALDTMPSKSVFYRVSEYLRYPSLPPVAGIDVVNFSSAESWL